MRHALLALLMLTLALPAAAAEREVLPNGLRVIVSPNPATEVMTAELMLAVPAAAEPADQQGVRYLTQRLLLRGTTREAGDAMGERLAAVGGSVEANAGLDYVELTIQTPADGFDVAMSLLAAAAQDPAFLPEEVESEKQKILTSLRGTVQDPFQRTYQALRLELYGDAAYGRWVLGDPRVLAKLTRDDVVRFYGEHYGPEVAVLSIAGGVDPTQARRVARECFGRWSRQGRSEAATPVARGPLTSSEVTARELPVRQLYLMLGFPAPAVGEPGYYAMQVIDSLLSGGSTARLPKALRDEDGLVYQVSSFYPTLAGTSHFCVFAVADYGDLTAVKRGILRELERLRDGPVSAEELTRAKRYLLGTYALSRQQSRTEAYSAAWYEILGRPPTFESEYQAGVKAVTAQEVQEAAHGMIHHFILALTVPSA